MTNESTGPAAATEVPGDLAILLEAARWKRAGQGVAVARVIQTWGSSPRPVGSVLAIDNDLHMIGSVSGGCVETAVVQEAQDVIAAGAVRILEFGVSDEQAWDVGLACGGTIRIVVEPLGDDGAHMSLATVDAITARCAGKQSVAVASRLADGSTRLVDADDGTELGAAARAALAHDRAEVVTVDGAEWFLHVFNPPLRLVIIGAVHIAQHLVPLARQAGYAITLVDPRAAFASEARFPGVDLRVAWPGRALATLEPDHRTAVVVLSHDPKIDDPGLRVALESEAFYVGALGSRRTHAGRVERLRADGLAPEAIGRIHAPIGLDLGGRSPAEIALSIMAEITRVLRRGEAR